MSTTVLMIVRLVWKKHVSVNNFGVKIVRPITCKEKCLFCVTLSEYLRTVLEGEVKCVMFVFLYFGGRNFVTKYLMIELLKCLA